MGVFTFVSMFCACISFGCQSISRDSALSDHRREVEASAIKQYAKGFVDYEFIVSGTPFIGKCEGSHDIGRSITIIYLPENPTISRLQGTSQRSHSTFAHITDQYSSKFI